jgi:hypothetical protein
MLFSRKLAIVAAGLGLAAPLLLAEPAQAAAMVTYSWTTTNEGFGPHVDEPTLASFQAPLSDVLGGFIPEFDVSNIQMTYPGLTFDTAEVSIIGFDFGAFVDPTTGAFVFHDDQQGFAVIALDSTDPNFSTFLSILADNPVGGVVKDQFNALDHGAPFAGFPTAGFWTATLPVCDPNGAACGGAVPEPAAWALMILGFGGVGMTLRQRRRSALAS